MARRTILLVTLVAISVAACNNRRVAVPRATPPDQPTPTGTVSPTTPPPRQNVGENTVTPPPAIAEDAVADRSIDDINRDSPLAPAFFGLDSADLDAGARAVVTANAEILRRNPTWTITIEGHCDERGTPEYNLALGERRAMAVKSYLTSLGIAAGRVQTVSYGKEFPFDPGHTEEAWAKNRRGHFVVTAR